MRNPITTPSVALAAAFVMLSVAFPAGTAGAHADDLPLGVPVVLSVGETQRVSGTEVQVTFVDVPEYSLCPPQAQCVWAGRVLARFRLKRGTDDTTATLEWPGRLPPVVSYAGVELGLQRVEAMGLAPPGAPPGNRAPYRATVVVVKKQDRPATPSAAVRGAAESDTSYLRTHYRKREVLIPMRDGVKLFTAIYTPAGRTGTFPFLMSRTPYSAAPYGDTLFPRSIGPGPRFAEAGYIFVTQDVRGRYRSEGRFEHMTPHRAFKRGSRDVDESSDTFDTIDWLLTHVEGNNGRAGLWGISYSGFFATAGMIDAHPALKAVSPQAPQADWFMGDDTHHNGAFFLASTFNFMAACGMRGEGSSMSCGKAFDFGTTDGPAFFLALGSLANAESRYFKDRSPGWSDMMRHGAYDAFWQQRNILPHLKAIRPAVLVVGGLYDANNYFGALKVFEAIDRQSPSTDHAIVIGPWYHGQWARDSGAFVGELTFGQRTTDRYQNEMLLPFFEAHLKGTGQAKHPAAWVYETGRNQWRSFSHWPPKEGSARSLFLGAANTVSFDSTGSPGDRGYDEWVTDPANPVPFVPSGGTDMNPDYMARDQRFDRARADVERYRGAPLAHDVTIAGPVRPTLFVATTGTDGDWVVKLIDEHPDGFQELVRGDVMRAKFRQSFTKPTPLVPGQVTSLDFTMPDVFHTFLKGHRIIVQVQGSWFPLVDRNPQQFTDIYKAKESDFRPATQRVYRTSAWPSRLNVRVLQDAVVP